ncbi:MAG: serine--tRNA ligase [candidate division NC10 bacterium]|nr:serine--tRNA ligase [candidate division NC10 bacterium]
MLDLKFVRENLDLVRRKLKERGSTFDLAELERVDAEWRKLLIEVEELKHRRNVVSEEVGRRKRAGEDAEALITEMREVSARIKKLDDEVKAYDERLKALLLELPNLPHDSVPVGRGSEDNVLIHRWGEPRRFPFEPKPHWELGETLGILDLGRAAKLSGARFALLKGAGALLERALINFMLDLHTKEYGYIEVFPPLLVNADTMLGTGQLPKFGEELFKTWEDELYLIPTAEVPVTNLHRGEILPPGTLPLHYVACTPCFRREAGSYGKDVRGIMRQHQFNKVELVMFVEPENSDEALEDLTRHAAEVLKRLNLPYQVVALCTGDLGFAATKTYDIEVWLPSQGVYREISSCSNCGDFQARRAGIRFRRSPKAGAEYVHTLNGSGLAVGRTWIALVENYQQEDGSILIPEVLRPYMNGLEWITKS